MYEIDKELFEIPPTAHERKYPFVFMEIGQSFFIPCVPEAIALMQSRIYSASKGTGRKFSVRKTDGGVRCWRVK